MFIFHFICYKIPQICNLLLLIIIEKFTKATDLANDIHILN